MTTTEETNPVDELFAYCMDHIRSKMTKAEFDAATAVVEWDLAIENGKTPAPVTNPLAGAYIMRRSGMKVKDIARELRVSPSTVSRWTRSLARRRRRLTEMVKRVARDMGFVPADPDDPDSDWIRPTHTDPDGD